MEGKLFVLVLHPIRMRIMQNFLNGKKLTALQLVELMPDIPQATLYRHIKKLNQAGVLIVLEKNKVRGTIEKVYGLVEEKIMITPEAAKQIKPEEHMQYFTAFTTSLLSEFQRYISKANPDLVGDGLSYRRASLYLSDNEYKEMMTSIAAAVKKVIDNKPSEERKLRTLTTIVIPE